jgi:hypothetical protein
MTENDVIEIFRGLVDDTNKAEKIIVKRMKKLEEDRKLLWLSVNQLRDAALLIVPHDWTQNAAVPHDIAGRLQKLKDVVDDVEARLIGR